jgi:hypothetical protein
MTKKTETKPLECSICGGDIDAQGTWLRGHNAQPVTAGRCCTECNFFVVLPARITLIAQAEKASKS